jgi:hypothetical protein
MTRRTSLALGVVLTLPLLLTLGACGGAPRTLYGKSIDGHVLDAKTGHPISGAYVIYLWRAGVIPTSFSGHNAPDICYHAAGAVTDAQGRFHIDAWQKPQRYNVPNREPTAWAYAPGYVPDGVPPPTGPEREPTMHPNDVIRLQPSHATGDERLEELWNFIRRGCMHGGDSQRNLFPILKAAYDEAKSLAVSPEQLSMLHSFGRMVARTSINPDPMGDGGATDIEIEKFIRQSLQQ